MRLTGDEVLTQIQIYLNNMITVAHLIEITTGDEKEKVFMASWQIAAADLQDLINELREGKTIQDHTQAKLDFLFWERSHD